MVRRVVEAPQDTWVSRREVFLDHLFEFTDVLVGSVHFCAPGRCAIHVEGQVVIVDKATSHSPMFSPYIDSHRLVALSAKSK